MLLTALAILPGVILLYLVYQLDKIEKEPPKLLVKLLLFGALSIIPAVGLEFLGQNVLSLILLSDSLLYAIINNFLIIALVEEGCKFFFTYIGVWKNKAFDYRFDAVVYAICVSLGFAIVENIMYVHQFGLVNAIMRALMSVPGHCIFALYMGYYIGQAKMQEKMGNPNKKKSLWKAILIPVLIHGTYDFIATSVNLAPNLGGILFILFLLFVIGIEITAIIQIRKFSKEDMPMPY